MRYFLPFLIILVSKHSAIFAQNLKPETVYGPSCTYKFTPPSGWVIDKESGKGEALAVFYPIGSTWVYADVVMYTNYVPFNAEYKTTTAIVDIDINDAAFTYSPISIEHENDISAGGTIMAQLVYYTGFVMDGKTMYQANAYIATPHGCVVLILSSAYKSIFYDSLRIFEKMVASFVFVESVKMK